MTKVSDPTEESKASRPSVRLAALWAVLGSLSALAVVPYMLEALPPEHLEKLPPIQTLIPSILAQAVPLFFIASWIGLRLGDQVGLDTPIVRAWVYRDSEATASVCTLFRSAGLGLCFGAVILALDHWVFVPLLPEDSPFSGQSIPRWKGFLASFYGALGEEIVTRLFLMTLVAWAIHRLLLRRGGRPGKKVFLVSIFCAAVLFAVLHLPAAWTEAGVSNAMLARILLLNSMLAILFGTLYWKHGLEHAVVAHFAVDMIVHVLPGQ